jgi:hypothetical protein
MQQVEEKSHRQLIKQQEKQHTIKNIPNLHENPRDKSYQTTVSKNWLPLSTHHTAISERPERLKERKS